jgi:hypothetical protein
MARLTLCMAMSVDGFITGPGDDKTTPRERAACG